MKFSTIIVITATVALSACSANKIQPTSPSIANKIASGHNIPLSSFNVRKNYSDLPFTINIKGKHFKDVSSEFSIKSLDKKPETIDYRFYNNQGKEYTLTVNYKALPKNRSFPGNLDITLKNNQGDKLGYLFLAINDIGFLKEIGKFGLIVNDSDDLIDVNFVFDDIKSGTLSLDQLVNERFIQDTIISKQGFQMIRPVILEKTSEKTMKKSFSLDSHPYKVSYALIDQGNGILEFQHDLVSTDDKDELLERVYYQASSISTLREGMYASKFFDDNFGTFKLVYYPALGQTTPTN